MNMVPALLYVYFKRLMDFYFRFQPFLLPVERKRPADLRVGKDLVVKKYDLLSFNEISGISQIIDSSAVVPRSSHPETSLRNKQKLAILFLNSVNVALNYRWEKREILKRGQKCLNGAIAPLIIVVTNFFHLSDFENIVESKIEMKWVIIRKIKSLFEIFLQFL